MRAIGAGRAPVPCGWLLACAWLATGCSTIPGAAAMRVHDVSVASKHPAGVYLRVSGGQEFEFRISDAQFAKALRDSLVEAGIFSGVVALRDADYRLDVVLGDGQGLENREITVLWSLSRPDTHQTLWQELVTSHGRSYHFVGVIRQRRGLEMAAQENIRLGLEKLSRLDLPALVQASDAARRAGAGGD